MDVIFGGGKTVPLKDAAAESGGLDVLNAPTALSNYLPEIRALFRRLSVRLAEERLAAFLDEATPLLEKLGLDVILPKTLRREMKPRLVITAAAKKKSAGSLVTYLNLNELLDYKREIAIGDTIITKNEFDALVKQKNAVVLFRGEFVRIDTSELRRLFTQKRAAPPTAVEFLKAHLAGEAVLSFDARDITARLFDQKTDAPPPDALNATLRPYQVRGYNWVSALLRSGFGAILADDMGLGKTIQSIAVLLRLKNEGILDKPVLIVAPAALTENWARELAKFAPSLKVALYHGKGRKITEDDSIFITTYQTAVRDGEKLAKMDFSLVLVDEAQMLKNAGTRAAQTVKSLRSDYRLALSGTPVENRLEDLRSLFDFVLPGYLGGMEDFRKAWRIPIELHRDAATAERLRKITAPFLLRRLKTDKTIIADLPDKIVTNDWAGLEKEQAALYESLVTTTLEKSARLEHEYASNHGNLVMARSALILNLLTGLKQICDHPRVYDKESPPEARLSGKARLLLTILAEMLENRAGGEKALIFSQYVETLNVLQTIIKEETGEDALVYHGGLPPSKRAAVIDTFQNDSAARILLVSLRAGGLGLNLTAASQVIHYDLWYNPSVENQATDRAFRIGQQRNVFVHRFITRGTFEEKIDAMLTSKSELAGLTVNSGESWLTKMNHSELKELFER